MRVMVVGATGTIGRAIVEALRGRHLSLRNKLLGQVNLVRYGVGNVRDGGAFVLTSGMLAHSPAPDSAAVSLVNSGVEGFVGAAVR